MGSVCKKTDVSTSTTTPDAVGQKAAENILKAADDYYAKPFTPYTAPTVAPLTDNHQAGISAISDYAASNPTGALTGAAGGIYGTDANIKAPTPVGTVNATAQTVAAPANATAQTVAAPTPVNAQAATAERVATPANVQTRDVTAGAVSSDAFRIDPNDFSNRLDITQMTGNHTVDPNAYRTTGDYTTDVDMGRVNGSFQVNPAQYGANGNYDVSTDLNTTGEYGVDVAGYGAIGADGRSQAETLNPWTDPNANQRIVDENGPLGAVSDYQNPMTQAMLDPAVREVQRAAAKERNRIGGAATQSGAFGDARHGVLERGLNEDVMQTIGDMTSAAYGKTYAEALALRQADRAAASGGFQTALAGRSDDLSRALSADTTNRDRALAADTGNIERGMAAADANASRDLSADQFNANLGSSLDIFNQQMGYGQAEGNAARTTAIDQANRELQLAADTANVERASSRDIFNQQQTYAQEEGNVSRQADMARANADRSAEIAARDAALRSGIDVSNVDRTYSADVGNAERGVSVDQSNIDRATGVALSNADRSTEVSVGNANRDLTAGQFNAGLATEVATGNADRTTAVDQNNIDRATGVAVGNAERVTGVDVGNANRDVDVGQFNAGMDLQTQQANIEADMARAAGLNQTATTEQELFMQQLEAQFGAGNIEQQNQQNQYDVAYQEFLRQQADPANRLNTYAGAISGAPMGSTTVQETPQQGYPFLQAVGSVFGAVLPGFLGG